MILLKSHWNTNDSENVLLESHSKSKFKKYSLRPTIFPASCLEYPTSIISKDKAWLTNYVVCIPEKCKVPSFHLSFPYSQENASAIPRALLALFEISSYYKIQKPWYMSGINVIKGSEDLILSWKLHIDQLNLLRYMHYNFLEMPFRQMEIYRFIISTFLTVTQDK